MSADQKTLDVYDKYISDYKKLISKELKDANLDIFMKMIEGNGKVLDLGCGTGTASLELLKNGFAPFPVDASLEMIKVAEVLLGNKPRQISFDEVDEHEFYDAIWANFSLLHIKKNKFGDILKRLFFALKERGILFFSLNLKSKRSSKFPIFRLFLRWAAGSGHASKYLGSPKLASRATTLCENGQSALAVKQGQPPCLMPCACVSAAVCPRTGR